MGVDSHWCDWGNFIIFILPLQVKIFWITCWYLGCLRLPWNCSSLGRYRNWSLCDNWLRKYNKWAFLLKRKIIWSKCFRCRGMCGLFIFYDFTPFLPDWISVRPKSYSIIITWRSWRRDSWIIKRSINRKINDENIGIRVNFKVFIIKIRIKPK